MDFSKDFKQKYESYYKDISSKDYEIAYTAWSNIINSEMFDEKDLIEVMDNLVKRGNLGYIMEFNPINTVLNEEYFEELFFELDDQYIDKYKDFFISINEVLSLNDIPEFVVYHYGDKLNWEIILENTLNEEIDDMKINNHAYTLIKMYHEIMFSSEINNSNYKPALIHHFFKCLELGVEIPYDYMKESMISRNATFSDLLLKLINHAVTNYEKDGFTGFAELSFKNSKQEDESINLCIELILRRLFNDDEMLEFLEKIEIDEVDKGEEDVVTDFDIDDDLGF